MSLKYNEIGKTGMKVARLAFGASSLGGVFHDINEKEAINAVFTAVDNGLNFIDVSPYYGHYKAETVLGKALKDIPRDKYFLSTKVGRYGKDGVNTWDYSAKRATESVYESIDIGSINDIKSNVQILNSLRLSMLCSISNQILDNRKERLTSHHTSGQTEIDFSHLPQGRTLAIGHLKAE